MLRRSLPIVLLTILVLGLSLPFTAYAECPTYLTNLTITYINVSPLQISCGGTLNITAGVFYPDGTPVTLTPETLSFKLSGSCFSLVLNDVRVFPAGKPGFYACNLTYPCSNQTTTSCSTQTTTTTCDYTMTRTTTCYTVGTTTSCNQTCPFPTGTVNVAVLECGASDGLGNYGPTDDINSDLTLTPDDNSIVEVSIPPTTSTTQPPSPTDMFSNYGVPVAILILLVLAAVTLLSVRMRGRRNRG